MLMIAMVLLAVAGVATEGARGGELAQLVSYHVFRYVNRDELITIVNCDSMTYEIRRNHGGA